MDEKELNQEELNHQDICQGIIMAYFLVIAVIYPFYAPGGYMRIGEVKYVFFRNVSLVTLAVMAGTILFSIAVRRDWEWITRSYRSMSATDWFAYGYFVAVMLSYLCSAYKEDALWGVDGWAMGVITQVIFVFLYFAFSRYFHCDLRWIGIWLLAAVGVFLLGICNRYSVYPIAMEGQTETFISTLGNINWFCGYWSVTAPIGITLYWCSDRKRVRIPAAFYSVIAVLSGVTQGSNSAYLVFIMLYPVLLTLSINSIGRMYRFLEVCMMSAAGCLLGRFMKFLPGLQYNYTPSGEDRISRFVTALLTGNAALWMLITLFICYVLLRISERKGLLHMQIYAQTYRRFKGIATAAVILALCIAAAVLLNKSGVLNKVCMPYVGGLLYDGDVPDASENGSGYRMVFNEEWGNGRGAAWNCGINAYLNMDNLHKLVGVGPDCFADYVYDVPELADRLADQFVNQRLTNAHNEQLTLLVNVGALGWLCYAGLFLTAFVRYMRRAGKQPLLYVCAVSILTYTVHNMVSFQQILNTPYIFIVLGIGEKLYRSTAEGISYGQ